MYHVLQWLVAMGFFPHSIGISPKALVDVMKINCQAPRLFIDEELKKEK